MPISKERITKLLRWSEPYMKTDMVYLASSGFWLSLAMAVSMIGGFGLSLAFGNLVSPEVFGTYKFVFSLAGLFGTIALTTMPTNVTQAVARGFDGVLRYGFKTDLLWSIPSVILTVGAVAYYFWNGNNVIALSLFIAAIGTPLLSASNLYSSFLQGKRDFRRNTLYGFIIDILPPLCLIAVMLSGARDYVPAYVAAYFAVMIALSGYFYMRTLATYRPNDKTDPELIGNTLHLSGMSIFGRAVTYVDKILIFHFLGPVQLAVYTFAAAPSQYVLRLNGMFRTLAFPKLAARDIASLKASLPHKIAVHFCVALIVTVLYVTLVPYFFKVFFPQYSESIPYAQALGLLILSTPGMWLSQTLVAHMRKTELYVINTIHPIIKIILFLILIPIYGVWGVIYATLIAGVFGSLVGIWVYRRL
ncbi:MAG TPA: oligosaccharide flippase family protein [Candidatus Paceibacterota bacterium]